MRGCLLILGCIGLLLGYAVAGGGITATIVHLIHTADRYAHQGHVLPQEAGALDRELRRCTRIGIDANDDPRCQAAWAENRRRFFDGVSPHDDDPAILDRTP